MDINKDLNLEKFEYLNLEYVQSISRGNIQIQKKVLHLFSEEIPFQFTQLRNAFDLNLIEELGNFCHKLKSSFKLLGVKQGQNILQQIENDCAIGKCISVIRPYWEEFLPIYENSMKELNSLLDKLPN